MEHICANYDLTPGEVHAAWSFYCDHQAEIDRRLAEANERFDTAYAHDHERREQLRQQYRDKTGRE